MYYKNAESITEVLNCIIIFNNYSKKVIYKWVKIIPIRKPSNNSKLNIHTLLIEIVFFFAKKKSAIITIILNERNNVEKSSQIEWQCAHIYMKLWKINSLQVSHAQ